MEDNVLKNLWNTYTAPTPGSPPNALLLKATTKHHPDTIIRRLLLRRILEALVFAILSYVLIQFMLDHLSLPWVFGASLVLSIFCNIGFIGNLLQIKSILAIDFSAPVAEFQKHLLNLRLFSLQTLRLLFLSIPFYLAYAIIAFEALFGIDIMHEGNTTWIIANIGLSILLLIFSIWLFVHMKPATPYRWIKRIISDNGENEISRLMLFLDELNAFKEEE